MLIIVFILVGMLEIIIGIPLLLEKIKPNWLYGFRLTKILSNDEIWYKSNKYVGRDFIIAGIIVIFSSLILLVLTSCLSVIEITMISPLLLIVPLIIIWIRGLIYLHKLED